MNPEGAFKEIPSSGSTLEDVARAAGVSPATVSRCLNKPDMVRPELKARVEAAIRELDYVPHGAARSLASRRSRMIGAVFPSLDTELFGGVLEALQDQVGPAGYTLVVASSDYDVEQEREHVRTLLASGIDALMLLGGARPEEVYRPIRRKKIPYVIIWVSEAEGGHPCIGFDNAAGGAVVARHLLDMGHRRVGVVTGPLANNDRQKGRLAGIRAALRDRGLALEPDLLVECPFGVDQGREAFRRLMSRDPRPTAVICCADPFAYGALFESRVLGLTVPTDVSISGFDDMPLSPHLAPGLTTIRTPRREMGTQAGKYLLAALAGTEPATPRPMDFELIVRGSTAPPPKT